MRASSPVRVSLFALWLTGCHDVTEDTGPFDCFSLGGGYEGADMDRLEEICLNGSGTNCDPEGYMEADAARCFAVRGNWDETYQTTLAASLAFSAYFEVVGWGITRPDDPEASSCVSLVHATTGERLLSGCGAPR